MQIFDSICFFLFVRQQYAVFEPGTRNTGTAIAGKNIANPIAMISASVDMLYFLGHKTYGDAIANAIRKTIVEDKVHTPGNGCDAFEFDDF